MTARASRYDVLSEAFAHPTPEDLRLARDPIRIASRGSGGCLAISFHTQDASPVVPG